MTTTPAPDRTVADAIDRVYAHIDALETGPVPEPRYRVDEWFWPWVVAGLLGQLLALWLRAAALRVLP